LTENVFKRVSANPNRNSNSDANPTPKAHKSFQNDKMTQFSDTYPDTSPEEV